MSPLAAVFVIGFASFRLTRLINRDQITAEWRHRLYRRFPPNDYYREITRRPVSMIGVGIDCSWCLSVWITAAVTAIAAQFIVVPAPVLVWAAACSVAGFSAKLAAL